MYWKGHHPRSVSYNHALIGLCLLEWICTELGTRSDPGVDCKWTFHKNFFGDVRTRWLGPIFYASVYYPGSGYPQASKLTQSKQWWNDEHLTIASPDGSVRTDPEGWCGGDPVSQWFGSAVAYLMVTDNPRALAHMGVFFHLAVSKVSQGEAPKPKNTPIGVSSYHSRLRYMMHWMPKKYIDNALTSVRSDPNNWVDERKEKRNIKITR